MASLAILTLIALGGTGCKKLLEVDKPANEILITNAFNDSTSAVAAVTGIYSMMMNSNSYFEWGGISLNTAKSADDVLPVQTGPDGFSLDSLTSLDLNVANMWEAAYRTLLFVNTALEQLNGNPSISSDLKNQLLGECYFLRAFTNFNLVNLWGDATAVASSSDFVKNNSVPSAGSEIVYSQIINDLKQSQNLLTDVYPAGNATLRSRPNIMAANALLARVYLYRKQYSDAIVESDKVINAKLTNGTNVYSLPGPASAFLQGSNETIWSIQTLTTSTVAPTPDGDAFVSYLPSLLPPKNELTKGLANSFETGDLRKSNWTQSNTLQGTTYVVATKYKKNLINTAAAENYIVLRLAEQYLIQAEAYCNLGDFYNAVFNLNKIRSRAGLPALDVPTDATACMAAIEQERRVELFAEWGHRWFDLKRWPAVGQGATSRADEVLKVLKPAWKPNQELYPVPYQQIIYNSKLVQNPGY